ncbi:hypothetical protein B296_00036645 [Ensete ventricosum]|uniref:Uncharacterized protein n=1 Tax=Ensete ventricosum TaxID=4639 RepID=A0A426Z9G3_ENSVE|nr:hypothetical protein B296_00036645 [Ensete ventricosum]
MEGNHAFSSEVLNLLPPPLDSDSRPVFWIPSLSPFIPHIHRSTPSPSSPRSPQPPPFLPEERSEGTRERGVGKRCCRGPRTTRTPGGGPATSGPSNRNGSTATSKACLLILPDLSPRRLFFVMSLC